MRYDGFEVNSGFHEEERPEERLRERFSMPGKERPGTYVDSDSDSGFLLVRHQAAQDRAVQQVVSLQTFKHLQLVFKNQG